MKKADPLVLMILAALVAAPVDGKAQPRLRDRPIADPAKPAPGAPAATATATAGATPAAPTPAPAPPPGGATGTGTTGTGTTGTGTTGAAGATKPGATTTPTTPSGKAQGDTTNLSQFENALEFEPRPPGYKVAFSLEDADLAELVRVISQLTGKRFIFGGKVKNIKASVYSPQKVTVAEAYQAFLSILEANKLTVVPHGRFLKIVDTDAVQTNGTPIYGATQGSPNEDRFVTRMHRLGHISADDAAGVLSKFKSKSTAPAT
jgi:general secretion pathway protein D